MLIAALDSRLKYLQDVSIDPQNPHAMDAAYDEEIIEPLLAELHHLHESHFGSIPELGY